MREMNGVTCDRSRKWTVTRAKMNATPWLKIQKRKTRGMKRNQSQSGRPPHIIANSAMKMKVGMKLSRNWNTMAISRTMHGNGRDWTKDALSMNDLAQQVIEVLKNSRKKTPMTTKGAKYGGRAVAPCMMTPKTVP